MTAIIKMNHVFEYDSIREVITMDGEIVYREYGDGEIDLRRCDNGEEFWDGGKEFTLDDFITEIIIPSLIGEGAI